MAIDPNEELISAFLDGELSAEEKRHVEQLLVEHAEYRQLFEELRALRGTFAALPRYRLPEDLSQSVLRRAEQELLRDAGRSAPGKPAPAKSATAKPATPADNDTDMLVERPAAASGHIWRARGWRAAFWPAMVAAAAIAMMVLGPKQPDGERQIARAPAGAPEQKQWAAEETFARQQPQAEIGGLPADQSNEFFQGISDLDSAVERPDADAAVARGAQVKAKRSAGRSEQDAAEDGFRYRDAEQDAALGEKAAGDNVRGEGLSGGSRRSVQDSRDEGGLGGFGNRALARPAAADARAAEAPAENLPAANAPGLADGAPIAAGDLADGEARKSVNGVQADVLERRAAAGPALAAAVVADAYLIEVNLTPQAASEQAFEKLLARHQLALATAEDAEGLGLPDSVPAIVSLQPAIAKTAKAPAARATRDALPAGTLPAGTLPAGTLPAEPLPAEELAAETLPADAPSAEGAELSSRDVTVLATADQFVATLHDLRQHPAEFVLAPVVFAPTVQADLKRADASQLGRAAPFGAAGIGQFAEQEAVPGVAPEAAVAGQPAVSQPAVSQPAESQPRGQSVGGALTQDPRSAHTGVLRAKAIPLPGGMAGKGSAAGGKGAQLRGDATDKSPDGEDGRSADRNVEKLAVKKQAANNDTADKDTADKDTANKDAASKDAADGDVANKEADKKEAARQESAGRELKGLESKDRDLAAEQPARNQAAQDDLPKENAPKTPKARSNAQRSNAQKNNPATKNSTGSEAGKAGQVARQSTAPKTADRQSGAAGGEPPAASQPEAKQPNADVRVADVPGSAGPEHAVPASPPAAANGAGPKFAGGQARMAKPGSQSPGQGQGGGQGASRSDGPDGLQFQSRSGEFQLKLAPARSADSPAPASNSAAGNATSASRAGGSPAAPPVEFAPRAATQSAAPLNTAPHNGVPPNAVGPGGAPPGARPRTAKGAGQAAPTYAAPSDVAPIDATAVEGAPGAGVPVEAALTAQSAAPMVKLIFRLHIVQADDAKADGAKSDGAQSGSAPPAAPAAKPAAKPASGDAPGGP